MSGEGNVIKIKQDPRKNKYIVAIRRDANMIMTFIKFTNRIKHPRVTFNLFVTGVLLAVIPTIGKGAVALPGVIICYGMGALLVLTALFRQYLSLYMMKANPETKLNEELTYLFGNTGVRVLNNGVEENLGYYKTVYKVWEDEKNYYLGMNEDDLVILPKKSFEEGDPLEFRDFILEKSGSDYRWIPTGIVNRCKDFGIWIRMRITQMREEAEMQKK